MTRRSPYCEPDAAAAEYAREREVALERLRYAREWVVAHPERFEHRSYLDAMRQEQRNRLCLEVFGRKQSQVVKFEPVSFPSDWWQAFKQRFFPNWALRRWPVQLTTVTRPDVVVDAEALFPELVPLGARDRLVVRFYANEPGEWR